MYRFSLSAAGQPCQYLPGTDANLPMATAGFESVGYMDVMSERCDVVAAFFFPMLRPFRGGGTQCQRRVNSV